MNERKEKEESKYSKIRKAITFAGERISRAIYQVAAASMKISKKKKRVNKTQQKWKFNVLWLGSSSFLSLKMMTTAID